MKKFTLKTFLVAALAMLAGNSWADTYPLVSTWTYSGTMSENTIGTAFSGSTEGLVSVTLGTETQKDNWTITTASSKNRGIANTTDDITYDATNTNVPVGGTFMKVVPAYDVHFVVGAFYATKSYTFLVTKDNTKTQSSSRFQNAGSYTCDLKAGVTYYIYSSGTTSAPNAFSSFTATEANQYALGTEITAATALYNNDTYTEGKDDLKAAIDDAQAVYDDNTKTSAERVTAKRTLIVAEGTFKSTNGNDTYAISESEELYIGKEITEVKGIKMTYGGKEGTDTWSYVSARGGSVIATMKDVTENTGTTPTQGTFFVFEPTVNGKLTIKWYVYASGAKCTAYLSNGDAENYPATVSHAKGDGNNTYTDTFNYTLQAGTKYYLFFRGTSYGNGLEGFTYTPTKAGTNGYTTYSNAGYNYTVSGADAYYAPNPVADNKIVLSKIPAGQVIPANEGVILKAANEGDVITINLTSDDATALTGNHLVAVTSASQTVATGTNYVLATKESSTQFVSFTSDDWTNTLNAALVGKCYLNIPSGSAKSLTISFEDETTGISQIENGELKVDNPVHKYIENGRLVINKNGKIYNATGALLK